MSTIYLFKKPRTLTEIFKILNQKIQNIRLRENKPEPSVEFALSYYRVTFQAILDHDSKTNITVLIEWQWIPWTQEIFIEKSLLKSKHICIGFTMQIAKETFLHNHKLMAIYQELIDQLQEYER